MDRRRQIMRVALAAAALLVAQGADIRPEDISFTEDSLGPPETKADKERSRVLLALDLCAGNQTKAAEMLGVSRRTLINRLDQLGLPRPRKS